MPDQFPPVMKEHEAAAYLQVSEQVLAGWRKEGTVPALERGKVIRYSRAALDAWLLDECYKHTNGGEHGRR